VTASAADPAGLAHRLSLAHRNGLHDVDPAPYAAITRDDAFAIQRAVQSELGASTGLIKTAIAPDGLGAAAPIYAAGFGHNGFQLPSTNVIGLELEIGFVLASDLTVETAIADEIAAVDAIDHYFVGVEICGTRYTDRPAAGYNGGLADNMAALGYVMDPTPRVLGAEIENFDAELHFAGQRIHFAPTKHSFGTVLASYIAYARNQQPHLPLKAGTIITTGSLCGLVPISGTGAVLGKLGNHTVTFDIV
jgi:2-keto-4-pentenoate hydratase